MGGGEENKGEGGCILFCLLGDGKEIKLIGIQLHCMHVLFLLVFSAYFNIILPFHTCLGLKHYSSSYSYILFSSLKLNIE